MSKDFERLFSQLKKTEPPAWLYPKILERIARTRQRSAKIRAALYGLTGLVSLGALVPTAKYTSAEFAASGLYGYLALAASDISTTLANWKTVMLTLVESLPIVSILTTLMALFVLIGSLKLLAKETAAALLPNYQLIK